MKHIDLRHKFTQATRWNGALFLITKINKTCITFFLFSLLSHTLFSLWANVYSLTYIALLWLNFGFGLSLPQYSLKFAKNYEAKKRFIRNILIFKGSMCLLVNIILFVCVPRLTHFFNLAGFEEFFYLGGLLFFVESIKSTIRFIYHSYFWNKQFNLIESIFSTLTTVASFLCIYYASFYGGLAALRLIFYSDIIGSTSVVLVGLFFLKGLMLDADYNAHEKIDEKELTKSFATHSLAMWGTIITVSLTERNFLVPFITATLGHQAVAIFKVANDSALLFQRFVLKTIGTSGTSLFSHVEYGYAKAKENIHDAAAMLTNRILILTLPLVSILTCVMLRGMHHKALPFMASQEKASNFPFTIFFILTSLYLVQALFLSHERILEVKRDYKLLYVSFAPYIAIILFYIGGSRLRMYLNFDLALCLLFIHGVRILSLTLRVFFAQKKYGITFPFTKFFLGATCAVIAGALLERLLSFV
jgi:hypothetical protein